MVVIHLRLDITLEPISKMIFKDFKIMKKSHFYSKSWVLAIMVSKCLYNDEIDVYLMFGNETLHEPLIFSNLNFTKIGVN